MNLAFKRASLDLARSNSHGTCCLFNTVRCRKWFKYFANHSSESVAASSCGRNNPCPSLQSICHLTTGKIRCSTKGPCKQKSKKHLTFLWFGSGLATEKYITENVSKLNTTLKQTNASWFPVPEAAGWNAAYHLKLIQTFQTRLQANKGQGLRHPGLQAGIVTHVHNAVVKLCN